MDYRKAYQLARIIIQVRLGTAPEKDRALLLRWLDESEENRQTYKRIIRGKSIRERIQAEEHFDRERDLQMICRSTVQKLVRKNRIRRIRVWGTAAAAVCVGVVALNLISVKKEGDSCCMKNASQWTENTQIPRVKLILESGKQINLEEEIPERLESGGVILMNKSGALTYEALPGGKNSEEVMNKIVTSVGGEYSFTLSDGTRVWLNAKSELEFPVDFVRRERVVKLDGEAYFEVAPDAGRPFIVETEGMQTRVLGTSFNIQAYGNERTFVTTLLTGKVEVSLREGKETVVLEPGIASYWHKGAEQLNCKEVNVKNAIAWRYGNFVFEDEDIEVVMRVLSRWYGVEFVFEQGRKGKHTFSGKISKDKSLEGVLEMMTWAGGPGFRKEGNMVYVIEKK
ncbi:MAG: FecR domain-containing protein [Odoribacter sp.]|nr:FecR domain-containing protein [Odoribacter sp.]